MWQCLLSTRKTDQYSTATILKRSYIAQTEQQAKHTNIYESRKLRKTQIRIIRKTDQYCTGAIPTIPAYRP